jgi:hypothetical protein
MPPSQSDTVRNLATANYVLKFRSRNQHRFSIPVAEVKKDLENSGFPRNHTPQICEALRSKKFLRANRLRLVGTDGPPSLTSTTVVFHYQTEEENELSPVTLTPSADTAPTPSVAPDPADDAFYRMRGFLKDVFEQLGGGEKFLRDLRSGDREL